MILALLRYMQFYAHIAHNTLGGETFFQDHEFLGELYGTYETDYDNLVERYIGLGQKPNLIDIHKKATNILENPTNYSAAFKEILDCEQDLCKACADLSKGASLGLGNMLADIADRSEARQYKIKQRLK